MKGIFSGGILDLRWRPEDFSFGIDFGRIRLNFWYKGTLKSTNINQNLLKTLKTPPKSNKSQPTNY
jgi:hypothetical protein